MSRKTIIINGFIEGLASAMAWLTVIYVLTLIIPSFSHRVAMCVAAVSGG